MWTRRAMQATVDLEVAFDLEKLERFDDLCPCYVANELGVGKYDPYLEDLARSDNENIRNRSIEVEGFRQSWKYIHPIDRKLRRLLRFYPEVQNRADDYLEQNIPPSWSNLFYVRVGIHVRRGDVLRPPKLKYGCSTPNETYFYNAMDYFTSRYSRVQFIVSSQDMEWSQKYINQDLYNTSTVNITHKVVAWETAVEDFVLLSSCDHMIMSTGSYGWWSGWLTRGTTIYYKNWPAPNTPFDKGVNKEDYFWPHWIPME